MLVREVMNSDIQVVDLNASVTEIARKMRDGDFGVVPVCDNDRIAGIITDRDIAIRVVAEGKDVSQCTARDVMTPGALTCSVTDDVETVSQLMADRQVRRLPVVDENKRLVGIVSVGDLAIMDQDNAGEALSGISEQRHDDPGATVQH
jgi:CBS domain-containing protein